MLEMKDISKCKAVYFILVFCCRILDFGQHASGVSGVALLQVRDLPGVAGEEGHVVGVQDLPGETEHQAGVQQVGP